jgi:hypothetical protein
VPPVQQLKKKKKHKQASKQQNKERKFSDIISRNVEVSESLFYLQAKKPII